MEQDRVHLDRGPVAGLGMRMWQWKGGSRARTSAKTGDSTGGTANLASVNTYVRSHTVVCCLPVSDW